MDYYYKYLKYKIKYLNLLEKTKRTFNEINEVNGNNNEKKKSKTVFETNTELNPEDDIEQIVSERDIKLSSLFNIFITEPLFQLSNDLDMDLSESELELLSSRKKPHKTHPQTQSNYNLRNVEFKLRREDSNFFIGSYTPEIIANLKSNGLDSTMVDDLVENFHQDDIAQVNLLNTQNPLYVNFDNNGKIIECWIGDNMCCPCCGSKSLRRYVKDNIPCIDLMCVNPAHEFKNGVKFFQVKAKSKNVLLQAHKNFDFGIKQIHTGSKAIGQYIHDISKGEEYYGLLIGYVCIEYEKIIKEPNEIIKILDTSFIILPKIEIVESKILFSNVGKKYNDYLGLEKYTIPYCFYNQNQVNRYYWYIDSNPSNNTIEFNTNNNDIIFLSGTNKDKLFGRSFPMKFITTDYNPISPRWTIIPNPFII